MKVGLIGGVTTSLQVLKALVRNGLPPALVYGYEPSPGMVVSGYTNMAGYCHELGLPYMPFRKINEHSADIVAQQFDVLFIVGLSQLVSDEIVLSPRVGCVGFHPTALPEGRGRAPMAWLVLEARQGAATFFQIFPDSPADSGPILAQSHFDVRPQDTARSVETKILRHIDIALDTWLPQLKGGRWDPTPQDPARASEYGVRRPEDGFIDWTQRAEHVCALVRASSKPHPGAFAFVGAQKIEITDCRPHDGAPIRGVTGRILKAQGNNYLIQCQDAPVWVKSPATLKVGAQLGVVSPNELFTIHQKIERLEALLSTLTVES